MRLRGVVRPYHLALAWVLCASAAVSFSACAPEKEVRGQLIVTFQTDMTLPQQIDTLLVQVTRSSGQVLHMKEYALGGTRNAETVPGTFALVAGDSREPVTITVAGRKGDVWRTYREVVTIVPQDRVAELRMPIQWLCNDAAKPDYQSTSDGKGGTVSRVVQKKCSKGLTCKAGTCVSSDLDSETLPDYKPADVFGGADDPEQGACFDVLECMSSGQTVLPDPNCSIALPAGDNVNVALRVAGGGICNAKSTACFVPLDGNNAEGWTLTTDGTRVQLPKEVCARLARHELLAVQTSTACKTKAPSLPPCGVWSSVPDNHAVVPEASAMIPSWPSPEVFTTLPKVDAQVCCPLMSEAGSLYSCICANDRSKANVYGVDMQSNKLTAFPLSVMPTMAAAVLNGALYWAGTKDLFQLPLQMGAVPKNFPRGGLYTDGVILADESGIHSQASGLAMNDTPTLTVVQLLHFSPNGEISKTTDPLGNRAVLPIAQDASSFYAGVNVDGKQPDGSTFPDGAAFDRVSSVVRIDKKSHQIAPLLNAQTLTITNFMFNGYLGVVSDGSDVFALFESEPNAGFEDLQIGRIAQAATAAASDMTPIYSVSVPADDHLTRLRLLGAVEGAVFFARDEWIEFNAQKQTLRSSSVMLIPRGSTSARFVADFNDDYPIAGVVASGQQVFWLNQSGTIFALSREALAP